MRICMLMSTPLPPREGIGFYVWNLARYLTRAGHQVQIVTRGGAGRTSRSVVEDIVIWRAPFLPLYPFHVHAHGLLARGLFARLEREVDLFHLHTPLVPWPRAGRPTLVTVHTPMQADAASIPATTLLGWLVKLQLPVSYGLERSQFRRAGRLAAVASSVAQELGAYGVDPAAVAVVGNGVDTDRFFPDGAGPETERPYVLTAGRLGPRKGLEDLIRCAELVAPRFPQLRFLVAGDGPFAGELRAAIERCRLGGRVVLLGHIADRERMADLYRRALAYVHPAHYEGLPTVLLEAMACGRPAVATAVSGALDVIAQEQNGLLVPPHAPEALATAVGRLVEDEGLARRLGAAGLRTITERYSWHVVARSYETIYRSLLEKALPWGSGANQLA